MVQPIKFNRNYLRFGSDVRAFERASEILYQAGHFLMDQNLGYRIEDFVHAKVSAQFLKQYQDQAEDESGVDLIWQMSGTNFFEIVLRADLDLPRYGGWLFGAAPALTSEYTQGYRVIRTQFRGAQIPHEYDEISHGYEPRFGDGEAPLVCAQRLARQTSQ